LVASLVFLGSRASVPEAQATTAPETLLRLVPEDMALCLVVEDLRGHANAFLASPFMQRFLTSPLGKELVAAPETAKLREVDTELQKKFQITLAQLRDDILGDAIVLAYSPGPIDKPERERGLFLLEARHPELLAKFLEQVLARQKESGEAKSLEERVRGPHKYVVAVGPHSTRFYLRAGAILAVTSEEALLFEIMTRLDDRASRPAFKGRFPNLDPSGRFLSLWINPKPYRPLLQKQASLVQGPQLAAFNTFLQYWNALDCVGIFVAHGEDCQVTIAIEGRPDVLPPGASNLFLKAPASSGDLAGRWPRDAFLTLTRSIDLPGAVAGVSEFMDAPTRLNLKTAFEQKATAVLGQNLVGETLPILGPDWGLCFSAPPSSEAGWFPHLLAAVRVHPTPTEPAPESLVLNALNNVAALAVLVQNQVKPGSMSLRSRVLDGTEIKYLVNEKEFPPGLQPAFACRGGYLLLGSSPAAIARFAREPSAPASATGPFFQLLFKPFVAYLRERREALAAYRALHDGVTKADASAGLERFINVFELLDQVDISSQPLSNGFAWKLRLKLAAPLR
jgi:hypothetical protein